MSVNKQTVVGADLSHHNPNPDFRKAKSAGLEWVIHKATEGSTWTDSTYAARRRAAYEAGLTFGSYHFARPDTDGKDAKLEALHAFRVAAPRIGDLVPALDFEVHHPQAEAWCKAWMAEMGRLLKNKGMGVPRGIHYGPDDFGKDYPHMRWVPRYNGNNTPPTVPYEVFQFSNGQAGVPNSFPGLGNVDLNSYGPGFDSRDMMQLRLRSLGAYPVKEKIPFFTMHASLETFDPPKQWEHDCDKVFTRAKAKKAWWVTGTEAGDADNLAILKKHASAANYRVYQHRSNWIAIDKAIVKKGTWREGRVIVEDNDNVVGPGHDSNFVWVEFEHVNPRVGKITVIACHNPTKGKRPGDPNHWVNQKYQKMLGEFVIKAGKGPALVWVGGDANMPNGPKNLDIFFDQPLTTYGDEIGKWPNTGHGPIDYMATYDADVRVTVTGYQALDDKRFFMFSDHFLIEGKGEVELLPLKAAA